MIRPRNSRSGCRRFVDAAREMQNCGRSTSRRPTKRRLRRHRGSRRHPPAVSLSGALLRSWTVSVIGRKRRTPICASAAGEKPLCCRPTAARSAWHCPGAASARRRCAWAFCKGSPRRMSCASSTTSRPYLAAATSAPVGAGAAAIASTVSFGRPRKLAAILDLLELRLEQLAPDERARDVAGALEGTRQGRWRIAGRAGAAHFAALRNYSTAILPL